MKKTILILIISAILILSVGCWDMVEINQRTFPYSVAVDLSEEEDEEYIITMTYVNLNGIGKDATQEERVFVVSTKASSIFEARKRLISSIAYPIYFKHLRVLVLGEELSKREDAIKQIMDGLSRDFVINKKLRIVAAKGKGKDILEAVPQAIKQEEIEGSLFALLKDNKNTSRHISKGLTNFINEMEQGDTTIPRIKLEGEDIKVFGGCIVKDYRVIGHIDEIDSRSISFIRNEGNLKLVDAPYKDTHLAYEVTGEEIKRKLIVEDKELSMEIDIIIEGALQEYTLSDGIKPNEAKELESMEGAIKDVLEKEINHIVNRLQKEYKSDPIKIGDYISKFHPKIWKEVSEDWEEIFSEMDIDINVKPKIRRRGLIQ